MLVDVFLRKATKKYAVKTRMESVQVGTTHVTDTRLGLERNSKDRPALGSGEKEGEHFSERIFGSRTDFSNIINNSVAERGGTLCQKKQIQKTSEGMRFKDLI